jgi:alpha-1,2-mannosyltransferase
MSITTNIDHFRLHGLRRAFRNILRCLLWLAILAAIALNAHLTWFAYSPGDLRCFIATANALRAGQNPYESHTPDLVNQYRDYSGPAINLSPPFTLLLFAPLAGAAVDQLYPLWTLASLVLFGISLALFSRAHVASPLRVLLLIALTGFWSCLRLGQTYMALLFLTVCAWLCLERRRFFLAGLAIGLLVAIKPNFIVWPVLLFFAGYRKASLVAFVTFCALSLLPVSRWGPSIYLQWLPLSHPGETFFPVNASLYSVFLRLGLPALGTLASILLLLASAIWAWRKKPGLPALSGLALLASLLASPVAWVGYTVVLAPLFLLLPLRRLAVPALLLAFPAPLVLALGAGSPIALAIVGSIYCLAMLSLYRPFPAVSWSARSGHLPG